MIYKIGDFYIDWPNTSYQLINDEFMKKFEANQFDDLKNVIRFIPVIKDINEIPKGKRLQYTSSCELYETERGLFIIYHWATCRCAIAYYLNDLDKKEAIIYINPKNDTRYPISANWFFSIAGLHHILLKKRAPILHASFIEWKNGAILFAAPSQTGKSTQAKLWNKYQNTITINDDRVLLRKMNGIWNAYGYPSCGSSKICLNKTLPIHVIVILEQSKLNKIIELTDYEKIKSLVAGIEVYLWNLEEIDMSFDCAKDISEEVKIIKLACRPDEDAVNLLKKYLGGNKNE